jgi:hypothetical protein
VPTYSFIDPDGKCFERFMTVAELGKCRVTEAWDGLYRIKGKICQRNWGAEMSGTNADAWKKPLLSNALAVHPDQIPEAMAHARANGVNVDFHPDGRAILRSRGERKKYAKARGQIDQDGGYGD